MATEKEIRSAVLNHFQYGGDKFIDLVIDLIGRVEDTTDEENIREAIDAGMIYTSDQWIMLEHYCDPQTADFNEAYMQLEQDIIEICSELSIPFELDEE